MWDFFETVRHRHSVRRYRPDTPVEREKIHAVLEMACAAPSAGDLQSYHIHVVTDEDQRQALRAAAGDQSFITEAPVCLVFSSDGERAARKYGDRGRELFALQDATIAATYAQLAAVAAGLGSAWVGSFEEETVARILTLAPGLRPVAFVCLGYPAELPELTPRRHLQEMTTFL